MFSYNIIIKKTILGVKMETSINLEQYKEELVDLRRHFHMHPELGFQEFETQKFIIEYLRKLGLNPKMIAKTGVVALIEGKARGKTLLLRADMDALLVKEETNCEYKSRNNNVMHACGHDAHMAILLIVAKILVSIKDEIKGNIKLVFQPNEEEAGAYLMVEEGVLEKPKVDAAIALHIWTQIESGKVSVQEGPVMGAMDIFKLKILGKGGHTALPHEAINPLFISAQIINACQNIQTNEVNVLSPTLINFAKMQSGTSSNIIPEFAKLEGTIRYLYKGDDDSVERPKKRFERIISGICSTYTADYELEIIPSNFVVSNDTCLVQMIRQNAEKVVGSENLVPFQTLAGEDFSEFSKNIPSTLFFLGCGNKEKKTDYPHHHPKFNIDEDVMISGVEIQILNAIKYLNGSEDEK